MATGTHTRLAGAGSPTDRGPLVARQPLLDHDRRVLAYELRVHAGEGTRPALPRPDLELLTGGHDAFVSQLFTTDAADAGAAVPASRFIVEVPCGDGSAPGLPDTCRSLREAGYGVALDDYRPTDPSRKLLDFATHARMHFLPSSTRERQEALAATAASGTRLVAMHVDAPEVFDEARREGFTCFQGAFLERRGIAAAQPLTSDRLVYLEILRALSDPELPAPALEDLVKRDAALSYRILRMVNSAGFAQTREITSMRHALLLVGRNTVARWASLAVLAGLGASAPQELVVMAAARARFCEQVGARLDDEEMEGKGFLAGLCSLLDSLLQQPMRAVLGDMPVSADVKAALLGFDNRVRHVLDCATSYERGDWTTCLDLATLLGLDTATLAPAYLDSLRWARDLTQAA